MTAGRPVPVQSAGEFRPRARRTDRPDRPRHLVLDVAFSLYWPRLDRGREGRLRNRVYSAGYSIIESGFRFTTQPVSDLLAADRTAF